MAIVQNLYTGNGTTVLFPFSFDYLDQSHVKVTLNGVASTAFVFANDTTIQFLTAPLAGVAIVIYRETDNDQTEATFFSGSAIKATDLNDNFTQTLYSVQESNFEANSATTTANTALSTANTALSTSNTALSNSSAAVSTANSAVSTANAANASSAAAVSTANTASSNASAAVTTANAASAAASTAVSTANAATSTANTALSNSATAISTANTASTNASNAVTTANTASSNATTAVATANAATLTANTALSTANTALSNSATAISTANSAISAVASAVIYTPVANLTALGALTPANGDYFELSDSTGAESSALITSVPVGLIGAPGLTFRLRYDAPPGIFTFLGYFANDSETRYLKLQGGTVTGNLEIGTTGSLTFEGSTADAFETTLAVVDPTADRTITLPNVTGTVVTTGDTGTVTSTMILDGTILNADVNPSAAIAGTKISPDFGSQTIATTGVFSHALGAAATPSITFTGDPNTGFWSPAADTLAASTGGSERLRIDSSGRLGLGTSAPQHLLDVVGSSPRIRIYDSSTGFALSHHQNASGDFFVGIDTSTGSTFGGSVAYQRALYSTGAYPLSIFTNGTRAITIDSSQRVGIGTTTVSDRLHLRGVAPNVRIDGGSDAGTYGVKLYGDTTEQVNFTYNNQTGENRIGGVQSYIFPTFFSGGSERARIDTSGRLLVGTSTSASTGDAQYAKLQVKGNTFSSAEWGAFAILSDNLATSGLSNNNLVGGITFADAIGSRFCAISAAVDGTPGANDYPGRLVFSTTADGASSPTERMRIHQGGEVSVGSTANGYDGTNTGIWLRGGITTLQASRSSNPACNFARIGTDGAVVTFEKGTSAVGSISVTTTATAYNTSSDYRLKENVIPLSGAIDRLQQIPVHRFNFIADPDKIVDGFIAHEAQAVVPECVTGEKDAVDIDGNPVYQGIDQSKLVPLLTAALQEAIAKIETLEAKVAALEAS